MKNVVLIIASEPLLPTAPAELFLKGEKTSCLESLLDDFVIEKIKESQSVWSDSNQHLGSATILFLT